METGEDELLRREPQEDVLQHPLVQKSSCLQFCCFALESRRELRRLLKPYGRILSKKTPRVVFRQEHHEFHVCAVPWSRLETPRQTFSSFAASCNAWSSHDNFLGVVSLDTAEAPRNTPSYSLADSISPMFLGSLGSHAGPKDSRRRRRQNKPGASLSWSSMMLPPSRLRNSLLALGARAPHIRCPEWISIPGPLPFLWSWTNDTPRAA